MTMIIKLLIVISLAFSTSFITACSNKSPQTAPDEFYTHAPGNEGMLMDPLIIAGNSVVPLIIEKVKDKNMPRRRYAIGFLGNGSYRQALPVLQAIIEDKSESSYFRADALEAVNQIDEALAKLYAQKYHRGNIDDQSYKPDQDSLNYAAKRVLKGDKKSKRSYWEAYLGIPPVNG